MDETSISWKDFFDSHAPHYLENSFTKWTKSEVQFLIDLSGIQAGNTILDLGCGVGRHAVEFAARGYKVTGVDISSGMLDQARMAAAERGVTVDWIESAIADFSPTQTYDLVVCLCEGGFGLIGHGENAVSHDLTILHRAFTALKPGGLYVMTAMNGYGTIRIMTDEHVKSGVFDPATMISHYNDEWTLPEGPRAMRITERLFIPPEVVAMMRHVGFTVKHVWGGTAGEWGDRPLKLDEIEAMYVGQKPLS